MDTREGAQLGRSSARLRGSVWARAGDEVVVSAGCFEQDHGTRVAAANSECRGNERTLSDCG